MAFENPDPTFAHQADRVYGLCQLVADVRDRHSSVDADARRVNLNNIMMAANAATATLRMLWWAKQGGESVMIQALGLSKPEYVNLVAEDLLRSTRLFLVLESQFQIETLFRNILTALGKPATKQGFYVVAKELLNASGIPDPEARLGALNVGALLRNSMHSNGIHHGYQGASTVEIIDGVEFRFDHGQRVQCGSWFHIVAALRASLGIVDELLATSVIKGLAVIRDEYAAQRATDNSDGAAT
ncbi:MAG TPA: hypothetical protein VGV06_10515 [Methylomirabilota bacterium]|nr:hypothetical protein [Methylomirabilota bacterium]